MSPGRKAKSQSLVSPLVVRSVSLRPAAARHAFELGPRIVTGERHGVEVIHSGAPEAAVADAEAGRLDDRGVDAEAGAGAHHRAGVLGDVGLVQGEKKRRGGRLMGQHAGACATRAGQRGRG